mgnify:CR=1 FL=1
MVESIYTTKNKILEHIENEIKNMDRVNVHELGELVDMVKDLAEAEKSCWEATYYKSVSEAMDASGYDGSSMQARAGYTGMRGYHQDTKDDDVIELLSKEYRDLGPDERLAMRKRVFSTLGIK